MNINPSPAGPAYIRAHLIEYKYSRLGLNLFYSMIIQNKTSQENTSCFKVTSGRNKIMSGRKDMFVHHQFKEHSEDPYNLVNWANEETIECNFDLWTVYKGQA